MFLFLLVFIFVFLEREFFFDVVFDFFIVCLLFKIFFFVCEVLGCDGYKYY